MIYVKRNKILIKQNNNKIRSKLKEKKKLK